MYVCVSFLVVCCPCLADQLLIVHSRYLSETSHSQLSSVVRSTAEVRSYHGQLYRYCNIGPVPVQRFKYPWDTYAVPW